MTQIFLRSLLGAIYALAAISIQAGTPEISHSQLFEGVWETLPSMPNGVMAFQSTNTPPSTSYPRSGFSIKHGTTGEVFSSYIYTTAADGTQTKQPVFTDCPAKFDESGLLVKCSAPAANVSRHYQLRLDETGVLAVLGSETDATYSGSYVRYQPTWLRVNLPHQHLKLTIQLCELKLAGCETDTDTTSIHATHIEYQPPGHPVQHWETTLGSVPIPDKLDYGRTNLVHSAKPADYGLSFVDLNFDGTPDLLINSCSNCAGYGGPTFDAWIMDKSAHRYWPQARMSELMSEQGTFSFDARRGQFAVFGKSGCCYHQVDTYRVAKTKQATLTLIQIVIQEVDIKRSDMWVNTQKDLVGGRWKIHKWREKISGG